MMKKYLYVIASLLLFSGIAYAYYGGSSGVMTDTNCNQAQYFNIGVLCQDADDGKLYKGTGSAIEQIQAYDTDLDTWAGITPSTDVQTMLGSANATAIRSNIGLGTIATQNADNLNATGGNVTGLTNLGAANLTVTGAANVTGASFTGLTVGSVTGAAATADLADDLATASHSIYKDSAGNITNIITAIDASAANTTIDLIPGICATIHNYEQGDANAVSTLPAVAEGLCFTGLVTTTEDDKTFRLNAAAANTICLGATCGKDDIGFATGQNTKGGQFKCLGIGSDWFCHTITGTVDAGDL